MPYYLHRETPPHNWEVVTERPTEGEIIDLTDCHWFSEAQAEADRRNGTQDGGQGSLPIERKEPYEHRRRDEARNGID